VPQQQSATVVPVGGLSYVWDDAPLTAVASWLYREAGVGLVWPGTLDAVRVSGGIVAANVEDYMAALGRRVGARPCLYGSTWALDVTGEGAETRVRIPARPLLESETAALAAQYGVSVQRVGAGWIVSGKQLDVREACEALGSAVTMSYVVEVLVLSLGQGEDSEAWIRQEFGGSLGLTLTDAGIGQVRAVSLDVVGQCYRDATGEDVVYRPTLAALLGQESRYTAVRTIPVAKTAVSDAGTVTVTGYDEVQVGTTISVTVLQDTVDGVLVKLDWQRGELVGESGDYPTSDTYGLQGVYLLPVNIGVALSQVESSSNSRSRYLVGFARKSRRDRYLLALRVTRGDVLVDRSGEPVSGDR